MFLNDDPTYNSALLQAQKLGSLNPYQGFRIPTPEQITAAIVQHDADEGVDHDRVIREARKVIADAKGRIGKAQMAKKYQCTIHALESVLSLLATYIRVHAHELTQSSDEVLADLERSLRQAPEKLKATLVEAE